MHEHTRILRHWRAATAEDLANGLAWYDRAADVAAALAAGTDGRVTPAQAAGVIAALSPRCGWSANVRAAATMIDAYVAGQDQPVVAGLGANRAKAWRVLTTPDPLTVLRGPKVRAFYANITGDCNAVTVDVWAAAAATGSKSDDAPRGRHYEHLADAYRRAASLAGVTPRDMQAAVWTHYRRTHARAIYDLPEAQS